MVFRQKNQSWFEIEQIYLQTEFRETIQTRAYTLEGLVGNTGGYIGLFLGYALSQLPTSVASLLTYFKTLLLRERTLHIEHIV